VARRDYAGERRSHFGAERDLAVALVGEVIELADDLVAALFGVQLEGLQGRTIVFDESVSPRDITPDRHEVVAGGQLLGIEVAKSW
jgi:hypothetical protein